MAKKNPNNQQNSSPKWSHISKRSLILIVSLLLMISCSQKQLPPEISVVEAHRKYQEGAFLLDVRTQEEWDQAHIPNTIFIPLEELPERIKEIPTDKEIIIICRSGNRSKVARDILLDAGLELVTSSQGGLISWNMAGYPLEIQP